MSLGRSVLRAGCVALSLACTTVALGSCTLAKNQLTYDRSANKDRQDFRDVLSPQPGALDAAANAAQSAPVPDFQSVVSTPSDLKLPAPLVTVSVNQTVGLRDLMFELADQAGIDVEIDPQVKGSIIFTAKERPFNEVVDRICELAGLRYTYQGNVLHVELDRPYLKNYKIDYLGGSRTGASDINTSLNSSGSNSNGAGGATSTNSGSSSKIEAKFDGDFWKDIEDGLKQLLASSDAFTPMTTGEDPVAVPELPVAQVQQTDENGNPVAGGAGAPVTPSNVPPSLTVSVPPAAAPGAAPAAGAAGKGGATYSISRQTGLVSVYATDRQQRLVSQYFDNYRKQATTQVLIEARVLQVDLSDEFASGIDWGTLNLTGMLNVQGTFAAALPEPGSNLFTATVTGMNDMRPVINALSRFGTVRSLSSPRVTVLNNQTAVVNVATNLIYFTIDVTVTPPTDTAAGTTSFETQQQSVPEGVLLTVTPTANADTGQVILALRPTVSKKVDDVEDPAIALNCSATVNPACATVKSIIPQMSVQEIDSLVKLQSGQTLVMGGLMKDSNVATETGLPVLSDMPLVGALFRGHQDTVQKSELVIFLNAKILPGSTIDDQDRKLYKTFGGDTHPLPL